MYADVVVVVNDAVSDAEGYIPDPKPWNAIMEEGRFTSDNSIAIKEIIDKILDSQLGGLPNETLRKEMEMQQKAFPKKNVYELFIWSFEERFEERSPNMLGILREAIDRVKEGSEDITTVARAVGNLIADR